MVIVMISALCLTRQLDMPGRTQRVVYIVHSRFGALPPLSATQDTEVIGLQIDEFNAVNLEETKLGPGRTM